MSTHSSSPPVKKVVLLLSFEVLHPSYVADDNDEEKHSLVKSEITPSNPLAQAATYPKAAHWHVQPHPIWKPQRRSFFFLSVGKECK